MADREYIQTDDGGAAGIAIGLLVVVAAVIAMFFFFGMNSSGGGRTIDIDIPAVTVDVQPDGQ
jgi:hypothetical protein